MGKTIQNGECIEYAGRGDEPKAYPQLKRNYMSYYVHRLIACITFGLAYDDDWVTMHTCDNPYCVRVEHLRYGTQKENMEDMRKKGRDNRKLSRADVAAIREDTRSQRDIAAQYNVSQTQIHNIQAYKQRAQY